MVLEKPRAPWGGPKGPWVSPIPFMVTLNHHTCVHNIEASCFPCSDNAPIGFSEVDKITTESIDVYNTIVSQLLPTPAKSHYTFNLRDLSKVFQGMLMVDGAKVDVSLPLDSISSFSARVFSARVFFCPCVLLHVRFSARVFFRPCVFPPCIFLPAAPIGATFTQIVSG